MMHGPINLRFMFCIFIESLYSRDGYVSLARGIIRRLHSLKDTVSGETLREDTNT